MARGSLHADRPRLTGAGWRRSGCNSLTGHRHSPWRPWQAGTVALVRGGITPSSLARSILVELRGCQGAALKAEEMGSVRNPHLCAPKLLELRSGCARYPTCNLHGCPCGHFGDLVHSCSCSSPQIARYLARISGPLLDRIDIQIEVPRLPHDDLLSMAPGATTASRRCPARRSGSGSAPRGRCSRRVSAGRGAPAERSEGGLAGRGRRGQGCSRTGRWERGRFGSTAGWERRRRSCCGRRCSSWGCRRGRMIGF
jgi:Magnesium chelatase, subunit ChlI